MRIDDNEYKNLFKKEPGSFAVAAAWFKAIGPADAEEMKNGIAIQIYAGARHVLNMVVAMELPMGLGSFVYSFVFEQHIQIPPSY